MTETLLSDQHDATSSKSTAIAVVGSINMDLVIGCQALPRPGETVTASGSREVNGGKGANQAVAAARAGGNVSMIGRVGDDSFAERLVEQLRREAIDCASVMRSTDCASGLAVVAVEESGQNAIMVVPNANGQVSPEDVRKHAALLANADVVLLQLEIPIDAVLESIRIAHENGARIILDPAPVPTPWDDALLQVDLVCPNETEASAITGLPVSTVTQAEAAARQLHARGAAHVAITMGDRGTVLLTDGIVHTVAPYPIKAIDTTAAGDAFAGALAVWWAETNDLIRSVQLANAAGAIAASRMGAQTGIGTRSEIIELWSQTK
ncbi:ribokinase [Stieleria varia]|uniref:Ribokinase n=1 Tax=Stieleria varia TaxID=2528005 RepID=A0A5C6B403_9BACT|nr:ribokinase [Stieleria varia]TWU06221.1 Ribokinase [Stieleria varia]